VEYFKWKEEQEEGNKIGCSRRFQKNRNAYTSPKITTHCQDGAVLFIISVVWCLVRGRKQETESYMICIRYAEIETLVLLKRLTYCETWERNADNLPLIILHLPDKTRYQLKEI